MIGRKIAFTTVVTATGAFVGAVVGLMYGSPEAFFLLVGVAAGVSCVASSAYAVCCMDDGAGVAPAEQGASNRDLESGNSNVATSSSELVSSKAATPSSHAMMAPAMPRINIPGGPSITAPQSTVPVAPVAPSSRAVVVKVVKPNASGAMASLATPLIRKPSA